MGDTTQIQPEIDDVRDVLQFAFLLLHDCDNFRLLLDTLLSWSDPKPGDLRSHRIGTESANRFVFNAAADARNVGACHFR